jgi:TetR/AcrR family transcriptional regulator, transcriptional repressor for nem operon
MEDMREYIIDQAYKLFLNHSYEAVSINEISKAIGFTKGALYHHFTSKEELFKAVIDKYLNFTEKPDTDLTVSLSEYIETSIEHARIILESITNKKRQFEPMNLLSLFIDSMRHYPESMTKKIDLFNSETEKIKKVLENAIISKEIRSDIDISLTAYNYFSLIYSIANNLIQNIYPESALQILRAQLFEFYKLLKA